MAFDLDKIAQRMADDIDPATGATKISPFAGQLIDNIEKRFKEGKAPGETAPKYTKEEEKLVNDLRNDPEARKAFFKDLLKRSGVDGTEKDKQEVSNKIETFLNGAKSLISYNDDKNTQINYRKIFGRDLGVNVEVKASDLVKNIDAPDPKPVAVTPPAKQLTYDQLVDKIVDSKKGDDIVGVLTKAAGIDQASINALSDDKKKALKKEVVGQFLEYAGYDKQLLLSGELANKNPAEKAKIATDAFESAFETRNADKLKDLNLNITTLGVNKNVSATKMANAYKDYKAANGAAAFGLFDDLDDNQAVQNDLTAKKAKKEPQKSWKENMNDQLNSGNFIGAILTYVMHMISDGNKGVNANSNDPATPNSEKKIDNFFQNMVCYDKQHPFNKHARTDFRSEDFAVMKNVDGLLNSGNIDKNAIPRKVGEGGDVMLIGALDDLAVTINSRADLAKKGKHSMELDKTFDKQLDVAVNLIASHYTTPEGQKIENTEALRLAIKEKIIKNTDVQTDVNYKVEPKVASYTDPVRNTFQFKPLEDRGVGVSDREQNLRKALFEYVSNGVDDVHKELYQKARNDQKSDINKLNVFINKEGEQISPQLRIYLKVEQDANQPGLTTEAKAAADAKLAEAHKKLSGSDKNMLDLADHAVKEAYNIINGDTKDLEKDPAFIAKRKQVHASMIE